MKRKSYVNSKSILIYKDGQLVKKCHSMTEASDFTGAKVQNIYKALNGYKTTLGGYTLVKDDIEIQDILKLLIGHRNYVFNVNDEHKYIEYGDLKCDSTTQLFYIDTVGTISFDELRAIIREKKIDCIL